MRRVFLWAARNDWLKERLPRLRFMRRAVRRFMPGETLEDALAAAVPLQAAGIGTMYTRLGENLENLAEADEVADHYIEAMDKIVAAGITGEISVKPTQLGLDHDAEVCLAHLVRIAEHAAAAGSYLWIDMEGSAYAEATIELYERLRAAQPRTGICLQAYLRRTAADFERLLPLDPAIRLVKGAYDEPESIAYRRSSSVDAELRRARGPLPARRPRSADPARARDPRRRAHRADRRAGRRRPASGATASRSRCCTASAPTSSTGWQERAIASRRSSPTASTGIRGTCVGSPSGRPTSGSRSARCCRSRRSQTMRIAARMGTIGTESAFEVTARARALEAEGRSIVHLQIGEPDFDTPANVREAAKRRSTPARRTTRRSRASRPCARRSPPTPRPARASRSSRPRSS